MKRSLFSSLPHLLLSPDAADGSGSGEHTQSISHASGSDSQAGADQSLADVVAQQFKKSTGQDPNASDSQSDEAEGGESGSENEPDKGDDAGEGSGDEADKTEKEGKEGVEKEDSDADGDSEGEGEGEGENEGDKDGDKKEDAAADGKAEVPEAELKGPVPLKRFQSVAQQRDEARQTLEGAKPMIDNYRQIQSFCQRNSITPEQFKQVMEVQALLNNDPEKALAKLMPIVDTLQGFVGGKLPPDLQKAVDDGDISSTYAKELAQMRSKLQFGESRSKHSEQLMRQQQEQETLQRLSQSAQSWEASKRKTDPDYKPGSDKWQLTKRLFIGMLNEADERGNVINKVASEADMAALLDKAYQQATKVSSHKPSPTRRSLRSNGSSRTSTSKPIEELPTLSEVAARVANQHGVSI